MSMPPTPPGWEKFIKGSDDRQLERDRDEAISIARELARLATCMDAIPQGSIGTQVHKLRLLEERIARETEFDNATRNA